MHGKVGKSMLNYVRKILLEPMKICVKKRCTKGAEQGQKV